MAKKLTTKTAARKANAKLKKGEAGWIQPISKGTIHDFMTILLIVSLSVNFLILIGWIILRTTTQYDVEVYNFLFTR